MNKENNIIIPSFSFSIKDYLQIFNISSLEAFNNFMKTRLSSDMSHLTVIRVFTYSMIEHQKSIINSPDIAMNIIKIFLKFIKKSDMNADTFYKNILKSKNIEDIYQLIL
jgi:hypothetical protein